jgi:maltooligosyltrehalose trehalohydrolase
VALRITAPEERVIPMSKDQRGYWRVWSEDVFPGTRYVYRLGPSVERPDPAAHFQPEGVHRASAVVDHTAFPWQDGLWHGIRIEDMIIYELHVGTFTPEGAFDAIIPRLESLRDLGVTAMEIMPVAQFPGERNWGYDGVYPFAVQNSYGGPEGLKRLVNACHQQGLAVILDVVYNHLGPEGNYLADFGPYFTDKYRTPWGRAINFDAAHSDEVRNFFIENALHWFGNYHIDALRLDAIHAIYDTSAKPFLQELAERVEEFSTQQGRKVFLIAESNLNDVRVIRPRESGYFGIDAQWCDDFHHSLRTLLTDERTGYYVDFGRFEQLVKAYREGFVYSWEYSEYRKRRHGSSSADRPAHQFVVFSQNHDQVGNRMLGERLSRLVSFEALKLAAGVVLLSPYIPLLFMGEEYGEESPFLYFVSHSDPNLIEAVRRGRKEEFRSFQWQGEPPDPQDPQTFLKSKLAWERRTEGAPGVLLKFYQHLIRLRREIPALSRLDKENLRISGVEDKKLLVTYRWYDESQTLGVMNFNSADVVFRTELPPGTWRKLVESSDTKWQGPGSTLPEDIASGQEMTIRPMSCAVYGLAKELEA